MGVESHNEVNSGGGSHIARDRNSSAYNNIDAAPMPKHIPFPEFTGSSELINEFVMFLFITFATAMQFINIYRTIWWVPESNTYHAVNVYLIEPYLVAFIVLLMSRRFLFCLIIRTQDLTQNITIEKRRFYKKAVRYSFTCLLLLILGICAYKIYLKHTFMPVFLLVYPSYEVEGAYFNGMPMHCCSSCPDIIREEIDVLRNDFNIRFKQILFTSLLNVYYAGIVPCLVAASMYYNTVWVYQNAFYVWISCLTMAFAFGFPAKYSDIMHRASLHLGYWSQMDMRAIGGNSGSSSASSNNSNSTSGSTTVWKANTVWTQNSVVKFDGELFSSCGPVTVAVPRNSSHSRFYKLFHNPTTMYMALTGIQASIVLTGLVALYYTLEWHFILSFSFTTLTNQFTFFKIMRDYLVTKRIYTSEISIAEQTKAFNSN
ncbi:unnamed protein product [Ceratitis capitata]|uniref:(Mediterranean fruit fly) hypothetical protein n=1 Tax=Ceratitis capitata TaxID=7213 RepID=A0A811V8I5_CERCA|nr:unnamed protein product [Ceratitis capitata]